MSCRACGRPAWAARYATRATVRDDRVAAPELSSEQMRLISRVANLEAEGRMILLVDPAQLLDRLEADVLAKFDRSGAAHAPKAS